MLKVTCALMLENQRIFCAQRSETMPLPLKWEFPGGKLEPGETEEACLVREIREELNVSIEIIRRMTPVIHKISKTIELIPFLCRKSGEEPIELKEHCAGMWVEIEALHLLDWAEADVAIVQEVQQIML